MTIRQREQQRGRDFDLHTFLLFWDYEIAYSVLKCNVHVQRKTAGESNIGNTLKEDKLCTRYKYRHDIFGTDWKIDVKVKSCVWRSKK
jgi:hypothetical protein